MPRMAAPSEITSQCRGSSPPKTQTELTIAAAAMPARVPVRLTAPLVPAGTELQVGNQPGLLAESLPYLARDRVGRSFGKRRRQCQQEDGLVRAEDKERGASRGDTQIGQHLGCISALAPLRSSQLLFALIAETGSDPSQAKDRNQRRKSARATAQIKHEAADGSGQRARGGHTAQSCGRARRTKESAAQPITRRSLVQRSITKRSPKSVRVARSYTSVTIRAGIEFGNAGGWPPRCTRCRITS